MSEQSISERLREIADIIPLSDIAEELRDFSDEIKRQRADHAGDIESVEQFWSGQLTDINTELEHLRRDTARLDGSGQLSFLKGKQRTHRIRPV